MNQLGIKENLSQFVLLIIINIFVGSMVGIERTILPLLGEKQFGLLSTSAALSFIVTFGFSKAAINYIAGHLSDKFRSRKKVLLIGWLVGFFVPILIIIAHSWWVIVLANILLGINQGLTWSMTVNMKIDFSNARQRGTAVGLNEFAGYSGVAIMAVVSGFFASSSLNTTPFYLGIGIAMSGFFLTLLVQDTGHYLKKHIQDNHIDTETFDISQKKVFYITTWTNKNLSSICISGLITNLKDGMAWGLFPLYFSSMGLNINQIGTLIALYPASWGFFQLLSGVTSDKIGRKKIITYGMWMQAFALWFLLVANTYYLWVIGTIFLGLGTAMVYPTLQAAISDIAAPNIRASAMGVYRFWRDCGYAFGALAAGMITDMLGLRWAIGLIALLPLFAGLNSYMRLEETIGRETSLIKVQKDNAKSFLQSYK